MILTLFSELEGAATTETVQGETDDGSSQLVGRARGGVPRLIRLFCFLFYRERAADLSRPMRMPTT